MIGIHLIGTLFNKAISFIELSKKLHRCEVKLVGIIVKIKNSEGNGRNSRFSGLWNQWSKHELLTQTATLLRMIKEESKGRRYLLSTQFNELLDRNMTQLDIFGAKVEILEHVDVSVLEDNSSLASEQASISTTNKDAPQEMKTTIKKDDSWIKKHKGLSSNELYELGKKYRTGNGIGRDPYKAFECFKMAGDMGNLDGKTCVATCYLDGTGVQKDDNRAYRELKQLSDHGHIKAKVNLGICYFNGIGVGKDIPYAFRLFEEAAEAGDPQAKCNLGSFYQHGCWVKQNFKIAVGYFLDAAKTGNSDAIYNLGRCYHNGEGMEKNTDKAIELYQEAADANCTLAICTLAHCYDQGTGVIEDKKKAYELYQKAAERGNIFAKSRIEQSLNEKAVQFSNTGMSKVNAGWVQDQPGEL